MTTEPKIELIKGDCLEEMDKLIAAGIKFDAIITDPPYGTTACKWDSPINFEKMWSKIERLRKDSAAVLLFGAEPFSSLLRTSNIKNYKYDWIFEKTEAKGHLNAKKQPMRAHENISVFYKSTYIPQKTTGHSLKEAKNVDRAKKQSDLYGAQKSITTYSSTERYPRSVIKFKSDKQTQNYHPTQKPLALMEYLVKTYTNEGEMILDFTMGSGTTGIACFNTKRNFVGIELENKYFNIAQERIKNKKLTKKEISSMPTKELLDK